MLKTWKFALAATALAAGLATTGAAQAQVRVVIGDPYYYPVATCYDYYGRPYTCAPRAYYSPRPYYYSYGHRHHHHRHNHRHHRNWR